MTSETIPAAEASRPEALDALLAHLDALAAVDLPAAAQEHLTNARQHAEALGAEAVEANRMFMEVSQARAKFVSVVTHELRLPLTSIKGYTDLIAKGIVGPVTDQQKNFLGVVRANVERMTALISDLADMSHAQTGRIKLNLKRVTLQEILDEVLLALKPRLDEKNQAFTAEIPATIGQFQADPSRLAQVLTTFLGNAQRYTPAGGKINLQANASDGLLRVQVSDTGCGISPDDQQKLFTAFFRSEDEAVREHPGWGLALHVAYLLIGLMGGQVGAESEFRKGSTFWFTIPMSQSE